MKNTIITTLVYGLFIFDSHSQGLRKFHEKIITLDTHADVPIMMAKEGFDITQRHTWEQHESQIDFPRMRDGGMDAMFFAVYMAQGTVSDTALAKKQALEIFDRIHKTVKSHPELCQIAYSEKEVRAIHKTGKRVVLFGMENGWPVGYDIRNLSLYHQLGLRYITLSHSKNNQLSDSSTDPAGPIHGGLSPWGETVVKEMNRLGIMVDVSHISDSAFYDVLKITQKPVIASHSSCRDICTHKRNMTDDMIRALAKNGGVIQINFVPDFVKKSEQKTISIRELRLRMTQTDNMQEHEALKKQIDLVKSIEKEDLPTVSNAVDHIDRVVQMVGINHVGIGMDMDGGGMLKDCQDVGQIFNITKELKRRGYSKADIKKIWGENLLRVMKENE